MQVDWLLRNIAEYGPRDAMIWNDRTVSYAELETLIRACQHDLSEASLQAGTVVSLEADFSPNSVALLLALVERSCVVVPLTSSIEGLKPTFRDTAEVEVIAGVDEDDRVSIKRTGTDASHGHYGTLRRLGHPGLVLFSSGSTGKHKASVHDLVPLLAKFRVQRHAWRTITFLLFDHIGGVNTLLYTLSNGGCVVTVPDRSPETVCEAIERHRVQMLPTSPTFLNLLLISGAGTRYDLSSLELVTYGTEVMPASTLERFHEAFPDVRMQQTYGLSEVGILRSKSRSSDSVWLKIGGEGFATRVVDGLLEIKAESAMLGYLNAPSPFSEDGWFRTGDAVEVDGEYLRFLGRREEIINVGGEKVYPAEVESVLHELDGVVEVVVTGEPNAITGQIVTARVRLETVENPRDFRARMSRFCAGRLAGFKIPQKVLIVDDVLHGERFKMIRRGGADS